jgi:hypothetical protein
MSPWVAIAPVVSAIRVLERIVPEGALLFDGAAHDFNTKRTFVGSVTFGSWRDRVENFAVWASDLARRARRPQRSDRNGTIQKDARLSHRPPSRQPGRTAAPPAQDRSRQLPRAAALTRHVRAFATMLAHRHGKDLPTLEGLAPDQIATVLQTAQQRVVASGARVDGGDGAEALAAAALIAAQVPGSAVVIDPEDVPNGALLELPVAHRALAGEALHRVLGEGSELARGWMDNGDAAEWRQGVQLVLRALE